VDGHPCPVICLAIKWGSTTVSRLLLEHGADPNAKGRHWDEYTPLAIAVRRDNQEIVEILLQRGAEINAAAHSSSGVTAIDTAAERHRIDGFVASKPRRSG
jgi:ankyrin repeat protein